jgi:hypothetical protein
MLALVEVLAPADWDALPVPGPDITANVQVGPGLQLLGWDPGNLEGLPGDRVGGDLYWQAQHDDPEAGQVVVQLVTDAGVVLFEATSPLAGGNARFVDLDANQAVRHPIWVGLPPDLEPGVYTLRLGRRRADGTWLQVKRGRLDLGPTYDLATIRVVGRQVNLIPPEVDQPREVMFSDTILLVGYELERSGDQLTITAHWQALASMDTRYKVFVHLTGAGSPGDIQSQLDQYPRLPATAWLPGEFLSDEFSLPLPSADERTCFDLLLGFYEEQTGVRLPVTDAGLGVGDTALLQVFCYQE